MKKNAPNIKYQNVKLWISTIIVLRQIYGLTGEKMVSIVDRLARAELERVKSELENSNLIL